MTSILNKPIQMCSLNPITEYNRGGYCRNRHTRKIGGKRSTRKHFLFNPNNPRTSFDVYTDKNPYNTIPIHYKTLDDVRNTIRKLEKLYKAKKYMHKRIWAVAMIMKVRLKVLKQKKPDEYKLAKEYFEFLGERTKLNEEDRYRVVFNGV